MKELRLLITNKADYAEEFVQEEVVRLEDVEEFVNELESRVNQIADILKDVDIGNMRNVEEAYNEIVKLGEELY